MKVADRNKNRGVAKQLGMNFRQEAPQKAQNGASLEVTD
jgi:hypothetical protein